MSDAPPAPDSPSRTIGGLAPTWALAAFVADVFFVFLFAFLGKESHEAQSALSLVLTIVWPYVVGLLFAWAIVNTRRWRADRAWPAGVAVWLVTYVLGTALRGASGRGLAPGFLIVSVIFLGLTLVGWRLLTTLALHYRARRS